MRHRSHCCLVLSLPPLLGAVGLRTSLPRSDAIMSLERVDENTRSLVEQSTVRILASTSDPKKDLQRERTRATFDACELENLLAGGPENVALRRRIAKMMTKNATFSKRGKYFDERDELYVRTLKMYLALPKAISSMNEKDPIAVARIMREFIDEPGGLDLHLGMFIPTIQGQGDEEQRKYWIPKCVKLECIGTYAQTELGHGTFLRGLETTATYDQSTEEFIVHSPTLTSTKWWPGGLGKTSTHAVVMARLFTQGKDHGVHPFVVQIRDNKNHQPLPGCTIGDIGNKMGYNAVDNGFLRFDHVRIPRRAMLMGHSRVEPDGMYVPAPVSKVSYGTMVFIRSDIVMNAALYMKKAVTIAIRYNLVRRQSNPDTATGKECQVIDYQHSQRTLFPILAKAFAFHVTSDYMRRMYFEFQKNSRKKNDFSALPELHATSSGLKAYCSWATKDAIEACRLTCGGHGYMNLAGFGTTLASYAPNVTYEGDNNVLCLQTARYLLKVYRKMLTGETPPQVLGYLTGASSRSSLALGASLRDEKAILDAYAHRAWRLVTEACKVSGELTPDDAMRVHMVQWITATKAHCAFVVMYNFILAYEETRPRVSADTLRVLHRLVCLHGLCGIDDTMGEFLEDAHIDGEQASDIRDEIFKLLKEIRPDAAALVDAFGLNDYFLNSALGAKDGDVYRRLYDEVQDAPLNKKHTPPGYAELLQPKLSRGNFGVSKL